MAAILVLPLGDAFKVARRVFKTANDTAEVAKTLVAMNEPGHCTSNPAALSRDVLYQINLHPALQYARNIASDVLRNSLKGVHSGQVLRCCIQPLGRHTKEKNITVNYEDVHAQKTEYHGFANMDASIPQMVFIETRDGKTLNICVAANSMVVWSCHDKRMVVMSSQPSASRMYLRWIVSDNGQATAPVSASLGRFPGAIAAGLMNMCMDPHVPILMN